MNYDYWLLLGQSQQTSVMVAQMRQLGQINSELMLQRVAQEHQAMLAQVLFETEQVAERLDMLRSGDQFAAGLLARFRLAAIGSIHAGLFQQYETKRAWATATERLQRLWLAVDSDPARRGLAHAILKAVEGLQQWQALVSTDPDAGMARFDAEVSKARKSRVSAARWIKISCALIPGSIVILVLAALVEAVTHAGLGTLAVALTVLAIIGGIGGVVVSLFTWLSAKKRESAAERAASEFREQVGRFRAFLASPEGGLLLQRVAQEHPALAN